MTHPQGGCLLWVEFPASFNATAVYEKALIEIAELCK